MTRDYEAYYREQGPNALGPPGKFVTDFLSRLGIRSASILDVGCGQGRDALHAAALGHRVHGVDSSATGIAQMLAEASAKSLPVTGEVADLTTWASTAKYDVILFDRVLHMLGPQMRLDVFTRTIDAVHSGGYVVLIDEAPNVGALVDAASIRQFTVERQRKGNVILRNPPK